MSIAERLQDLPSEESEARARILGVAFRLFMQKGYRETSTLEIATRAKVSKRDLYALIGNKEQIFRACVATRARRMTPAGALPAVTSARALKSALIEFGTTLLMEVCHPAVVGVYRLVVAEGDRSPELMAEVLRVRQSNRDAIARFLAGGQAAGLIGKGDVRGMAELFLDMLTGTPVLLRILGATESPSAGEAGRRARLATEALTKLYAA